jgi:hypothetical protein
MSKNPIEMNTIRSVLEMHQKQKAIKEIARVLGLSRNTVRKYIREYFGTVTDETVPPIASCSNKQIADVIFKEEQSQYNSERHIALIEHFNKERKHLFKRRGNKLISGKNTGIQTFIVTATASTVFY